MGNHCREIKAGKRFLQIICGGLVLAVTACGAGRPAALPAEAPKDTSPQPALSSEAQLSWYLTVVAGKEAMDDAALQQHFAPSFLAQIPPEKFRAFTESLRTGVQRLELVRVEATQGNTRLQAITRAATGALFRVLLAVEPEPPHRITALLVKPDEEPAKAPPVHSWNEAEGSLRALAPRVSLFAAEIEADRCMPIHELAADESLAVGSAFKLFVLGALAREVELGSLAWSDSLPGRGTRTLLSTAEKMIERSDNGAADDLVVAVGREAIEHFARSNGADDPRLSPLLLTRETFAIRYGTSDEEKARFAKGSRDQRLVLAREASTRKWNPPVKPSAVGTVGWFAPLRGLCSVAAQLHRMAVNPKTAPVGRLLAANPGVRDTDAEFSYIGYKGGSEPGLFNINFLLQRRRDGKWMYLGATVNDEEHLIDERRAMSIMGAIRSFLASAAVLPS